ncbi:MAG: hypothetical protein WBD41_07565 [Rhodococcus sp. (in: high G+C Gram-positive bacteria)]
MTDDQPSPTLRDLTGDLPPLPDEVWERTLAAAFAPDAAVDADLVPEQDDLPVTAGESDLDLGILLDDTDADADEYRDDDAGSTGHDGHHGDDSDHDVGHIDSGGELDIDPGTGLGDTGLGDMGAGEIDPAGHLDPSGPGGHPGDDLL